MTNEIYDAIIIGSGAGGASVAYNLIQAGKHVLMLEKGDFLPHDSSTLNVKKVFKEGKFKSPDQWVDNHNRIFVPEEFYNVGGKTKWYGAALLRFSPHEFEADDEFKCLAWPISYADMESYYQQAEEILKVQNFDNEPELQALIDKIVAGDHGWRAESLPLGLKKEILENEWEAKHFDGFASMSAYKSDSEQSMIKRIKDNPGFTILNNKPVNGFLHDEGSPDKIIGVRCSDESSFFGKAVVLAAGAMTSPRLLQDYLEKTGLDRELPSAPVVGAYFKLHVNSALLAFQPFTLHDVLRKTAIFFNDKFPHTTVQCLGWMDGEILSTQLPAAVPMFVANSMGKRAYGFFITTEDGSSPENRIISCGGHGGLPVMDYEFSRIKGSEKEHHTAIRAFEGRLLKVGLIGVSKFLGLAGTAHAMGSMITGSDPTKSVVDANGKVHGMENLYVGDGSVLPRASRVNPALTIYAWGLRLGRHLGER
jgi:choline dehydrogenase-like flavoprotein